MYRHIEFAANVVHILSTSYPHLPLHHHGDTLLCSCSDAYKILFLFVQVPMRMCQPVILDALHGRWASCTANGSASPPTLVVSSQERGKCLVPICLHALICPAVWAHMLRHQLRSKASTTHL